MLYVTMLATAIILQIGPDWAYFFLKNIAFSFIIELYSFVHFGGLGLTYTRWDILDMTMRCLQVYWEGSKIACLYYLFFFVYREGVLDLTAQLCLGWSSRTYSNTGVMA